MSECIQIVVHKGKKVVFFDCRGMKAAEQARLFPEVTRTCIEQRINRLLCDVTDAYANDELKAAAKEFFVAVSAKLGSVHSSLVGMKSIQRIIAQAVVKDHHFAKTKDEGLDYLVSKPD